MRVAESYAVLILISVLSGPLAAAADCPPADSAPLSHRDVSQYTNLTTAPKSLPVYERYLRDTVQGLNRMRGQNGLICDSALVIAGDNPTLQFMKERTTPTNIGMDLLVQTELAKSPGAAGLEARKNLSQVIDTLNQLPKYPGRKNSILFYDWYPTTGISVGEKDKDVSTVDNINLAIAIWTVAQTFPHEKFGKSAQALFNKIDFSPFYHPKDGLAGGNLKYDPTSRTWALEVPKPPPQDPLKLGQALPPFPEPWTYGDFGSEARSIYTAGYALGLFKEEGTDPKFVARAIDSLHMELSPSKNGKIMRVWDGGAFQELLPALYMNEGAYSSTLAESASAYGSYILELGKQQGHVVPGTDGKVFFPAAYSASQTGRDSYNGQQGVLHLSTTLNKGVCDPVAAHNWESVYTTHAAMLAASMSDPDQFAPSFQAIEKLTDGKNKMYNAGIGFSDAVHVKGDADHKEGEIVPVVLSLDKGMEAYAMMRMKDRSTLGPSAAAFAANPAVRNRLETAYSAVDRKFATLTPTTAFCDGQNKK